eukprot:5106388-Pleurochrysis_carterae.AAC.2
MKTTQPMPCNAGRVKRRESLTARLGVCRAIAARLRTASCIVSGSSSDAESDAHPRPMEQPTNGSERPRDCAMRPPMPGPIAKPKSADCKMGAVVCARLSGVAMSER